MNIEYSQHKRSGMTFALLEEMKKQLLNCRKTEQVIYINDKRMLSEMEYHFPGYPIEVVNIDNIIKDANRISAVSIYKDTFFDVYDKNLLLKGKTISGANPIKPR